jgi:ornithine cyclodeaminase/alanine dehydrogenase-like protein (mu-crystallin family)
MKIFTNEQIAAQLRFYITLFPLVDVVIYKALGIALQDPAVACMAYRRLVS